MPALRAGEPMPITRVRDLATTTSGTADLDRHECSVGADHLETVLALVLYNGVDGDSFPLLVYYEVAPRVDRHR